jgi:hypothetical protein
MALIIAPSVKQGNATPSVVQVVSGAGLSSRTDWRAGPATAVVVSCCLLQSYRAHIKYLAKSCLFRYYNLALVACCSSTLLKSRRRENVQRKEAR